MIISTKKGTPKEELEKIVDRFEKQGLDVTLITGKDYNVFGLVGDTTKIDERDVLANPWTHRKVRGALLIKKETLCFFDFFCDNLQKFRKLRLSSGKQYFLTTASAGIVGIPCAVSCGFHFPAYCFWRGPISLSNCFSQFF